MDPMLSGLLTSFGTSLMVRGIEGPFVTLDLIWKNMMYDINKKLEDKLIEKETLVTYKKEIEDEIEKINSQFLVAPRKSIIVNALEESIKNIDEEHIRVMYAKLIAGSMDDTKAPVIHPSFTSIISQLSISDAIILELCNNNLTYPCVKYTGNEFGNGYLDLSDYFIYPFIMDYLQTTISLHNLIRLNLIEMPKERHLTDDERYDLFLNESVIQTVISESGNLSTKKFLDHKNHPDYDDIAMIYSEVELTKTYIQLTSFGKSFLSICS